MWFDPATLLVAFIATITVGGLVLLWSWYQDQSEFALGWCGGGFILASIGTALFTVRDDLPGQLTLGFGPAFVLLGISSSWAGARAFNRKPISPIVVLAGPALWLAFSLTPAFSGLFQARAALMSLLAGSYMLLAGLEIRGGDPLRGRFPLALLLGLHGVAVLLRIPFILGLSTPGVTPFQGPWLGLVLMEAMVFIQVAAVLMIALTKERLEVRLRRAAETDPLTGLCNRRALFERGSGALAACARLNKPAAVAIFDLDAFKGINDTFGHAVGDAVLQAFSAAADDCLHAGDVLGRIGGEEFALVLPGCDAGAATQVARNIMKRFQLLAAEVQSHGIRCTASGGIAVSRGGDSIETLLGAADQALYDAKREGSNILRLAP